MNKINLLKQAYVNCFGTDFDFDFYAIFIDNVDCYELDELSEYDNDSLWDIVDRMCIYYSDQWIIAKHYHSSPFDVNRNDDLNQLFCDISLFVEEYHKLSK